MFLPKKTLLMAGDKTRTPKPARRKSPAGDLGPPEPTEEVDGDEIVSDWSYDHLQTPPPQKRTTPVHRQTRQFLTPHAF